MLTDQKPFPKSQDDRSALFKSINRCDEYMQFIHLRHADPNLISFDVEN